MVSLTVTGTFDSLPHMIIYYSALGSRAAAFRPSYIVGCWRCCVGVLFVGVLIVVEFIVVC